MKTREHNTSEDGYKVQVNHFYLDEDGDFVTPEMMGCIANRAISNAENKMSKEFFIQMEIALREEIGRDKVFGNIDALVNDLMPYFGFNVSLHKEEWRKEE